MPQMKPFADDTASIAIGGLTIENGTTRLAIYGSLDITRDQQGLTAARVLVALLSTAVKALEAVPDLPTAIQKPEKPKAMPNPFA